MDSTNRHLPGELVNHGAQQQKASKIQSSEWRVLDWLLQPSWVENLFETGRFPEASFHC